ncbi:7135_t:CDS:2 [Entrophospora sp. SA101]|nr:7135_t:CDS:2 [Entrophospora sp. SA101]CAJ0926238.1 19944_t:CDS:2 [Entrophospora sp. SA101]
MGLPCSHLIRDLTCPANGDHTDLQLLLQSLAQQYQFWPSHQQAAAHTQLEELSSAPPDVLENPEVSKSQGRPIGARN